MSETIEITDDGFEIWPWYNIMHDLKNQGHVEITIDPLTIDAYGCGGTVGENRFYLTWVYNKFLLVTMQEYSQQLVDAFSIVVGYKPFARYQSDGLITAEWDKVSPIERFIELQEKTDISNLTTFENEGGLEA